ncbi:putative bifunctional diguanylate cyclase/phosphodiesterase [Evansella tamaricis]|uniref:EAL domain-containing protein n=1 Tax=Evansella tamaricis TaxID=2069301 RepID=A0ABS6JJZ9_9BACI|nr:EAL domain-containing protein [Evansella tamaricis]MBU9714014.1 EAL domain-containing protein [Evansella tamaricis]
MSTKTIKNLVMMLFLIGCALLFKLQSFHFIYGITLSFSTIFLLVFVTLFGVRKTLIATLLIHFINVTVFEVIPWDIIYIMEVIIVGFLYNSKRKGNMVLWVIVFWIILGIPTSLISYQLFLPELSGIVLSFKILLNVFNAFINALIADIILSYIPLRKWLEENGKKHLFNFQHLLFHMIICAIIFPFLINNAIIHWNSYQSYQSAAEQLGINASNNIEKEISKWTKEEMDHLKLFSTIQLGYLNEVINRNSSAEIYDIVVTNQQGKVMSTTYTERELGASFTSTNNADVESISENFYQYLSYGSREPLLLAWSKGKYIYETEIANEQINLSIHFPISYYQNKVLEEYFGQLQFILLFLVFAATLLYFIKRIFVENLNKLAITTTGLPTKLKKSETIEWPSSSVLEINSLMNNFKSMSSNLNSMFQESNETNRMLENTTLQLKKSEEKLQQLAYYDNLTKLPNRTYFQEYLTTLLKEARNANGKIAVLFFDLNEFKSINDTLGHAAGDELLQRVANKFKKLETNLIKVFRLGGDEFVIVMKVEGIEEVSEFGVTIQEMFSEPFTLKTLSLYITTSVGVSLFPDNGNSVDELVKHADMAMYKSKEMGKNHIEFFNQQMQKDFKERMLLNSGLRQALQEKHFEMVYQPKINNITGEVSGFEALMRWNHPKLGNISPAKFIPLAEELGLIFQLDEWGLKEACRQNKEWQAAGVDSIPVSVNLSAKHFYYDHIVPMVTKALDESGLDPKYLKLEITESVFMKNVQAVITKIEQLKEIGVLISIDDFGIGYSSLNHLIHLPINEVKLDKNFISEINMDQKKAAIFKAIVELAKNMKLNVVAEGVETEGEMHFLKLEKCDEIQGYYYSKPLSKESFLEFIKRKNEGSK